MRYTDAILRPAKERTAMASFVTQGSRQRPPAGRGHPSTPAAHMAASGLLWDGREVHSASRAAERLQKGRRRPLTPSFRIKRTTSARSFPASGLS
jgi:hypothetical protein